MRGNQRLRPRRPRGIGSIPACAGEPGGSPSSQCRRRVYPRVCGGTRRTRRMLPRRLGLSPRVRGNLPHADPHCHRHGSIPACAGEPFISAMSPTRTRVYPRVCGGTSCGSRRHPRDRGLSPRVRGNHTRMTGTASAARSIPACAGEPARGESSGPFVRVYPRVCGGTSGGFRIHRRDPGLSPRVRGNRAGQRPPLNNPGSIPACAGEP